MIKDEDIVTKATLNGLHFNSLDKQYIEVSVLRQSLKELLCKIDKVIKDGVVCDLPHSDFFLLGHAHALQGVKEELDLMFSVVLEDQI